MKQKRSQLKKHKIPIRLLFITSIVVTIISVLLYRSFYSGRSLNKLYQQDEYRMQTFPYLDGSLPVEKRVNDLLSRMTVREKIGQLALVEKNSIRNPLDIVYYGLGAVMSGSGGKPESNTPQGWLEMVNALAAVCRQSRLGIPILYGVDTNHGHSNVPSATIFPHFIGLGATHDADLVRRIGQATGLEMRASNIFWSFSPDLDVITDTRWGRTYESFGSDPAVVAELGRAYIEGLQDNSGNGMKTMATAKHYLGTGAMEWKSSANKNFLMDQGVTSVDETVLRTVHLPPFKAAVDSGVMSIMAGLNSWQGQKMAANTYLLTNVLKEEMGFEGFIVSDWYGVYEISPNKYESLVTAVNAGVDMIMLPFDYKSFVTYMERAIQTGDISSERLDDAVRRILWTKFTLGLFDNDAANTVDLSVLGSKQHRELAREAVRKSLVLLKNEHNILPLSKQVSSIVISGQSADNLGRQSGGWTVEWQGIDGNWIPGTALLAGIKAVVSSDTEVKFNPAGNFPITNKADIGIAIVGEKPYAEGWGDTEYPALSETDLQTIQKTKAASKNLIVIILSGRPLDIKKHHQDWDTVVAAWLPGSEGQGVADVLFGDYPFTGTLPVIWELN